MKFELVDEEQQVLDNYRETFAVLKEPEAIKEGLVFFISLIVVAITCILLIP